MIGLGRMGANMTRRLVDAGHEVVTHDLGAQGAGRQCARCWAVHVVEIFLPLQRGDGAPQPHEAFARLRDELVERFGGLTAFSRAPAEGLWESESGKVERDQVVIFEVVAESLDRRWWSALRSRLEREFAQEEVLIRAAAAERL